ncbi:uncharacterized protein si:ch211-198p11.6 isoform X2 [Nerophis ophidion]|uniref:uncharacterized protein si:ch211-198p11.6 isoform X2 n=1 Tax=Nerophis ophidion TaxID=159077 RepID=UPI002ADFB6CB|nr:uncharacterized protein si:ch211-198p11.6 isoform X2 [Nerophis ophidion]XP_061761784.1 uncharacterized protein si:ch211-198p11.6 isoform X2 [Nerophis ophidion]
MFPATQQGHGLASYFRSALSPFSHNLQYQERYALACDCGCPSWSLWELCFNVAQSCDCRLPSLRSCLRDMCASPSCGRWDCACTCQPPECESCNCLCFEIRVK